MSLDEEGYCVQQILNAKESGEIIAQVEAETQSAGDS
jgi:hypothetical protein